MNHRPAAQDGQPTCTTLLIDNYDSFTFNLYQYLAQINGIPPLVVRNDELSWSDISAMRFDNIVISPGPGRPEVARDFGVCSQAILESAVPVLGVCLGHQGLCHLYGGAVDYCDVVMHGRASQIHHAGVDILAGIPSPFTAIRYHSLHVSRLSPQLEAIAHSTDGVLMAVRHRHAPAWGVQFHPESIGSEYGQRLLENFRQLTLTLAHARKATREGTCAQPRTRAPAPAARARKLTVFYRRIPRKLAAEQVFMSLFARSRPSFWLDSALVRNFSRFSYMGDGTGPHAEFVSYDLRDRTVTRTCRQQAHVSQESIFDFLQRELRDRHVATQGLPFDFNSGYVGYLGYELKAECGGSATHRARDSDAAFMFADRPGVAGNG